MSYLITKDRRIILSEGNELDSTCGISDEKIDRKIRYLSELIKRFVKLKEFLLLDMMMKINMFT